MEASYSFVLDRGLMRAARLVARPDLKGPQMVPKLFEKPVGTAGFEPATP